MSNYFGRINHLLTILGDREQREKKAEEIRKLSGDFDFLSKRMNRIIPNSKFILDLTKDEQLQYQYNQVKGEFQRLRAELIKIWGQNGEQIDVLEPREFSEVLDELEKLLNKLETSTPDVLNAKLREIEEEKRLAESFLLIPDIDVNMKPFVDAYNFLKNLREMDYSEFIRQSSALTRLHVWQEIQKQRDIELPKMDFDNIDGVEISQKVREFIKEFLKNKEVSFNYLDSSVLEEIKTKFPGLSSKLLVKLQ